MNKLWKTKVITGFILAIFLASVVMPGIFHTGITAKASNTTQNNFNDDFNSPVLDDQWQVTPGLGSYSLTDNPGSLRQYLLGHMASGSIWRSPGSPNPWTQSLLFSRSFDGDSWTMQAKATFNLHDSSPSGGSPGAQASELWVAFGDDVSHLFYAQRGVDKAYEANYLNSGAGEPWSDFQLPLASGDTITSESSGSWVRFTYWFELTREGQRITFRYSGDGVNYLQGFSTTLSGITGNSQKVMLAATVWDTYGSYVDWDYVRVTPNESVKTWYWTSNTDIASVARGDVDSDGKMEIVTGGTYFDGSRTVAQLCVWDGTTLALENVKTWFWTGSTSISSVAVGDVDGDGKTEIVTGGTYFDGTCDVAQLCVWDGTTLALENVKTWYWTGTTRISSVAVGDVDGDGKTEIVTGGTYFDGTRDVAQLCIWNGGSLALENVRAWYWTSTTRINSVAVGDVDNDGKIEIVTGGSYWEGTRDVAQVCVWNGPTLALENVKTWSWAMGTSIESIALGDADGDGKIEIVTGGDYYDARAIAQLCVWDGATLALENVKTWYWTASTFIQSVAVGDVDGDGKNELITGGYYWDGARNIAQLVVWSGSSLAAEKIDSWYSTNDTTINSVAVGDVKGDSSSEIVTGGSFYDGTRLNSQLTVWGTISAPLSRIFGLDFSPYTNEGQNPNLGTVISEAQITQLMSAIKPYTNWVRTFGCTNGLEVAGRVAHELGLKSAVGAWLSTDLAANEREISNLITIGKAGQADMLIVGSEVLLRGDLTEAQLIEYINRVRDAVPGIPVATADVYGELLGHPAVLEAGDVVLPNYYPYWEGVNISYAVSFIHVRNQEIVAAAGNRPVIISETGWPSAGNQMGDAVASPENAAYFFLNFQSWAKAEGMSSFYFEAFDELWKAGTEGPQGAHWGIWDKDVVLKPGMRAVFDGETIPDNWSGNEIIDGPGIATIKFTHVPPYGSFDNLKGEVSHVKPSDYRVVVYIKVDSNWWIKPTFASPLTIIQPTGSWVCDITTGGVDQTATEIAAYLIPISYNPPTQPSADLEQNAVAKTQIIRSS